MQRLEIENADIMKIAIQQEISRPEVSDILGDSPRIIEYWVNDFNDKGFAGLREGKRTGRPSSIDEAILSNIDSDLRQNPTYSGYTQNLWDGKMLSHHLKEKYGIKLGVRQCQRFFDKLDFRLRKPRPVIAKSDDEAKAEYKKNFNV